MEDRAFIYLFIYLFWQEFLVKGVKTLPWKDMLQNYSNCKT